RVDNQVLQARLRAENATLQTRLAQPCSLTLLPEWFDGNGQRFRGFINQCCLLFMMHPQTYTTDCAKVSLVINLLSGKALDWVSHFLECDSLPCQCYSMINTKLRWQRMPKEDLTGAE
uniref:DUF4939 domain-containing protein n=1 Tax=Terrapene triunguis TaxID=2587831 RepID=A0A674JLC9_9SAUR